MLFAYHELADGDRVGWRYFWEGRLSCKRAAARRARPPRPPARLLTSTSSSGTGWPPVPGSRWSTAVRRSATWPARSRSTSSSPAWRRKGRAQRRFAELHPDPEVRGVLPPRRRRAATGPSPRRRSTPTGPASPSSSRSSASRPELLGRAPRAVRPHVARRQPARRARRRPRRTTPPRRELSVVVPVWSMTPELAEMAARTVARIQQVATLPTEVIVVDNGSPHKRAVRRRDPRRARTQRGRRPGLERRHRPAPARRRSSCSTPTSTSSRGGTSPCTRPPTTGDASPSPTPTTATASGPAGPTKPGRPAGASS